MLRAQGLAVRAAEVPGDGVRGHEAARPQGHERQQGHEAGLQRSAEARSPGSGPAWPRRPCRPGHWGGTAGETRAIGNGATTVRLDLLGPPVAVLITLFRASRRSRPTPETRTGSAAIPPLPPRQGWENNGAVRLRISAPPWSFGPR